MLHAFNRHKSGLYERYLGLKDGSEKRVSAEDEITSLIMGPLDYMHPEDVTSFWRHVVAHNASSEPLPPGSAEHVEMHFWPNRGGLEPDLLVKLRWPQGPTITLLVEFKWRSPLSGEDQLHLQWRNCLDEEERERAYHLFIAPDISDGLKAQKQRDIWGKRLLLRSWASILEAMSCMPQSKNAGLQNWKNNVSSIFELLKIRMFRGFSKLMPLPPEIQNTPVFWNAWSGFCELKLPEIPDFSSGVFWNGINGFRDLLPPPIPPVSTCPNHFLWSTAQ